MRSSRIILSTVLAVALGGTKAPGQDWHLNAEPVYFFLTSPNLALDYAFSPSLSVGFQYAAIDWADGGKNLSGFQAFYSPDGSIARSSYVLKVYAGLLSQNTTLLKIESGSEPIPLFEVLYGYRWVSDDGITVAVLGGTFFTSKTIYPAISIPVGILF